MRPVIPACSEGRRPEKSPFFTAVKTVRSSSGSSTSAGECPFPFGFLLSLAGTLARFFLIAVDSADGLRIIDLSLFSFYSPDLMLSEVRLCLIHLIIEPRLG